jgi:hypothetical protein
MAGMFLDGVQSDHGFAGDGLIRPVHRQHFQASSSRLVSGLTMPAGTGSRAGRPEAEGPLELDQVAERDLGRCPASTLGGDDPPSSAAIGGPSSATTRT